jgi:hypothetical protein
VSAIRELKEKSVATKMCSRMFIEERLPGTLATIVLREKSRLRV